MIERKIYKSLLEWKGRKHKCLVVTGQRQVGKTFIIDSFARAEYDRYIYINFEDSPEHKGIFDGDNTAEELVKKLVVSFGGDSIAEGSTLLFLDEIQECERAYSALKQLTIYGKIDVIASGSLLGVKIPQDRSGAEPLMPIGYQETLVMHPVDFEEFLWAKGMPKAAVEELRACVREKKEIESVLYERASMLFREYMIVGGMPEAVEAYVSSNDFRPAGKALNEVALACIRDINRCNDGDERLKTADCFDSIPDQLAEPNKKFMYSRIKSGKPRRSSEIYMENLLWIKAAGYGVFCYGVDQPALPLKRYVRRDSFKVYLSDTGMLLGMYGDKAKKAVYSGDSSYNMGAVAENAVASEMAKAGLEPRYYSKNKGAGRMELDFVLEFWDGVAAIEVKSGKDRTAPSLQKAGRLFDIARRIMLEPGNIRVDGDGVEHYPLFACAFIRDMDPAPDDGPRFS